MKIALAQMSMRNNFNENYKTSGQMIQEAIACQLLVFPYLQLSPYFPQRNDLQADSALSRDSDPRMVGLAYQAKKNNMYIATNVYYETNHKKYAASLMFDRQGKLLPSARQVHVSNIPNAYEASYFEPSPTGYIVYKTPLGNIGVIVGKDIHYPESSRILALQGADLIIVQVAIADEKELEITLCELRSQAYENHVYIAMVNRVGKEGKLHFLGKSTIVDPEGNILVQASNQSELLRFDIDLSTVKQRQIEILSSRRSDQYAKLIKEEV